MAATVGAGLSLVSAVIACRLQPGTREVIRYPKTSRSTAPTLDAVIADGVRVLVRPVVRRRVVAAMGINALAGVLATALVGWAADASADGPQLLGVLTVAQGVGAVLAFSAILVSGREATRWSVALVAAALSMIVIGASGRPSIALVACTIFGASVVASELVVTVAIGTSSSGREVAAATGVLDAALVGAMVAGVLLSPVLGAVVGTPRSLVVVGCLPLAGGVLSLTGRPRWPTRVSLAPHAGADLARAGASVAPPPIALSRPDSSRVNRPAPIERT
jgi:hypothetical protein